MFFKFANGANSYFFINGTGIIKFKAKDSQKKTGLRGYDYDFSVN